MTNDYATALSNALDTIEHYQEQQEYEAAIQFSAELEFETFPPALDMALAYCLMALGRPFPAYNRLQRASLELAQSYDPVNQYLLYLALGEVYALLNENTAAIQQLEMADSLSLYLPLDHQCMLYAKAAPLWFLVGQLPRAQKTLIQYEQLSDSARNSLLPLPDSASPKRLMYALAYHHSEPIAPNSQDLKDPVLEALIHLTSSDSVSDTCSTRLAELIDALPEGLWKRWLLQETLKKLMSHHSEHKLIFNSMLKTL